MQAELQTALFHAFDTLNLQQVKSFNVPPVTLHGVGALAACGPQAQSRGLRHLFVMVDSFLHQAGMTAGLERSLAMKGIAMTLWPCPAGEPCVTDVCAAVAQLRDARCDGVVAFGGGSVLDAAKAVALLVANPEQTLGEMTEHSELRPRLPLIAVPTTAGTGSETTNVTVIIDAVSGRKQVLAHASLMPDVAILDAALTEGVPPHITAMTGIDALTHAVEAYSARHAVYRQSGDGGDSHDRRGAAESGGLRSGSGGAGEHAAGFLHGGDGVFQRRAGAMPCHGASAGGGAAYSARSGQRHAAANGDGV